MLRHGTFIDEFDRFTTFFRVDSVVINKRLDGIVVRITNEKEEKRKQKELKILC